MSKRSAQILDDQCARLCATDRLCREHMFRSFNSNGFCEGLAYIDADRGTFCLQIPETLGWCSPRFQLVPVADVSRLLERIRQQLLARAEIVERAIANPQPVVANRANHLAPAMLRWEESELIPNLGGFDFEQQVRHDLNTYRSPAGSSHMTKWRALGGDLLLARVSFIISGRFLPRVKLSAARSLMTLATMFDSSIGFEFGMDSGIWEFCHANAALLVSMLEAGHRDWGSLLMRERFVELRLARPNNVKYELGYSSNWNKACPDLLNTSRLREISLLHAWIGEAQNLVSPQFAVRRGVSFLDSVPILRRIRAGTFVSARFINELGEGIGAMRDWFEQVTRQIFNPEYALFDQSKDEPHYTIIHSMAEFQDEADNYYEAVGKFFGLSIINDVPLGVYLPVFFFKYLLDEVVVLEDLAEDAPEFHAALNVMRNMNAGDLGFNQFEIPIYGENILMTIHNREDLILRKINSLIPIEHRGFMNRIRDGFQQIVPLNIIQNRVSCLDLKNIIYGNPRIDIEDMRRNIFVSGALNANSPQITWLFNILESFDSPMRQKFVEFVTGLPRLPFSGFASLSHPVTIHGIHADDMRLPASHTCEYQLDLPLYTSEEIFKERIIYAINLQMSMHF